MNGWFLLLVHGPWTSETVWKLFGLSIINSIKDSIYWQGTGNIWSLLNKPLQDALGSTPGIILITLLCNLKNLITISWIAPKYNSVSHKWMKYAKYAIHKVSRFSTSKKLSNYKTSCTQFLSQYDLYDISNSNDCQFTHLKCWFQAINLHQYYYV